MNFIEQIRTFIKLLIENNLTDCVDCSNGFNVCERDYFGGEASMVEPDEVFNSCVLIYSTPLEKRLSDASMNTEGGSYHYNSTTKETELKWQIFYRFKSEFDTENNGNLRRLTNDNREKLKWHLDQFNLLKLNENLQAVEDILKLENNCFCGRIKSLFIDDIFSSFSDERDFTIGTITIYFTTINTEISNNNLNL